MKKERLNRNRKEAIPSCSTILKKNSAKQNDKQGNIYTYT